MSKIFVILLVILAAVVCYFVFLPVILGVVSFLIKAAITFGILLVFGFGIFIGRFFPYKEKEKETV
jgi:hypothetical protein